MKIELMKIIFEKILYKPGRMCYTDPVKQIKYPFLKREGLYGMQ